MVKKIDFIDEFNNYILISVSTRFIRDWITSRYLDQILQIIKNHKKRINRIELKVFEKNDDNLKQNSEEEQVTNYKNENVGEENATRFEPIFQFVNNELKFKYQRELIETGHEKANQPLDEKQIQAINLLEEILRDSNQMVTYDLQSGDMMFSNNRWLIHDRTSFEDHEDENLKRLLIRTWIREN